MTEPGPTDETGSGKWAGGGWLGRTRKNQMTENASGRTTPAISGLIIRARLSNPFFSE